MIINPYVFGAGSSSYLDSLSPQPRAVYSLRKMYSTATNCIDVRNTSTGATATIGFVGNALDTVALSAVYTGSESVVVTKWYDQAGNGEDANQATAASQPLIVNAGSLQSSITFDNSNDHLIVTSLAMGSAYCGIYMKGTVPGSTAFVDIMLEMSVNYNNNAQSWVFYTDSTSGGQTKVSSRNSTAANDFRLHGHTASGAGQYTILMDRSTTGTNEIQLWKGGVSQTSTPVGTPADQTGVYNAYDLYIGGRVSGSLYSSLALETLVIFNSDSSGIRTNVEALVA